MNVKQKTEKKVFAFMEEHHMLQAHEKIVAGISGGADSVCLLFVLLEYRKKVPFSLAVVHVNHGIRPEAGEDAHYVEELCKANEIPFHLFHVNVKELAEEEKCSEEEAGRTARYRAFARVAEEFGAEKIAVAHNANDRSETMLFHLFRGSSIKGLGSIRPVRENIIRPILCLERGEVEAYLDEQGISYCQDATNAKDDYTRNRIRHHILPYAEKEIVSGCVSHMWQTADMLAETEDYLEQQTREAMGKCVEQAESAKSEKSGEPLINEIKIDIPAFLQNHAVIRQRILYGAITSLASSAKDISHVHVKELLSLFTESGNRDICLPYGIVGKRRYDKVVLECGESIEESSGEEPVLEFQILPGNCNLGEFPSNRYTKWFDYDKIEQSLVQRTRKTGDYLTIAGKDGQMIHKSLKDYMIAEKIPREKRDRIPLIADGNHVVWLIGYRISEYYKIDRNTKRILQVQLVGKDCDSSETEEKNGRTC